MMDIWTFISTLVWPAIFLIVFWSIKSKIIDLFEKNELNIEIAGMKLKVVDATKNIGQQLADLQERVAKMESGGYASGLIQSSSSSLKFNTGEAPVNLQLLWVDDFPSNNAFLIDKMKKEGISVELSLDTDDALATLSSGQYHAIITDLGRRKGRRNNPWAGLDLIQKVRAADIGVPILVFAGQRGLDNKDKLIEAGASDVTQDSVDVLNFVQSVKIRLSS